MASKNKGTAGAKKGLKRILEDIRGDRTHGAVYGILSQATSLAATMTPVDTSNLINSYAPPEIKETSNQTVGIVRNTAAYAAAVHGKPGTYLGKNEPRGGNRGNMWDPSGEPEFMTKGLEEVKPFVRRIIKEAYKP